MAALSETKIRFAKPRERPYKLFDERGLFLLVSPTGGRLWRLRYRMDKREKLISLGTYPDVPLKRAREKRDEAHRPRPSEQVARPRDHIDSGRAAEQRALSVPGQ
jgi:hypothetical protein